LVSDVGYGRDAFAWPTEQWCVGAILEYLMKLPTTPRM
jgi:hypothetical protein